MWYVRSSVTMGVLGNFCIGVGPAQNRPPPPYTQSQAKPPPPHTHTITIIIKIIYI